MHDGADEVGAFFGDEGEVEAADDGAQGRGGRVGGEDEQHLVRQVAPLVGVGQTGHVAWTLGRGAGRRDQGGRAEHGRGAGGGRTKSRTARRQASAPGGRTDGRQAAATAGRQDDDRRRQDDDGRRAWSRRAAIRRAGAGGAGAGWTVSWRARSGIVTSRPRAARPGGAATGSRAGTDIVSEPAWRGDTTGSLAADRAIDHTAGAASVDEASATTSVDEATALDDAAATRHGHARRTSGKALKAGSPAGRHAEARAATAEPAATDAEAADGDAELRLGRPAIGCDQHGRGSQNGEEPGKDAAGRAEGSIV